MKKTVLLIMAGIIITGLFAFKIMKDNSLAIADQEQGFHVFYLCRPAANYDYLGTVKPKFIDASGKPEQALNSLLKRAKENFPNGNGLLISKNMQSADVIKFKEE